MIKLKLVGHAAHIEMINSHKMSGKPQRKEPFLWNGSWEKWFGDVTFNLLGISIFFLGHGNKLVVA